MENCTEAVRQFTLRIGGPPANSDGLDSIPLFTPVFPLEPLAAQAAPPAQEQATLEESLEVGIEGVVIATPSAPHAQQAAAALGCGVAGFFQIPLGRAAAAHTANCLLEVDFPDTDGHWASQFEKVLDGHLREVTV